MASEETKTTVISVSLDEQAKSRLLKGLQDVRAEIGRVAIEGVNLGEDSATTAKKIADLTKEERNLQTVLSTIETNFDSQTDSIHDATAAVDDYQDKLNSVKPNDAVGSGSSGNITSAISNVREGANRLGIGAVADVPLGAIEGVAKLSANLPKLKAGLETIAASSEGLTSTLATLAAGALPAAGAGFGTIAVAIAPIAIAATAVAATLALVSAGLDSASKAAALQAEAQTQANNAVNEAITHGTTSTQATEQATTAAEDLAGAQRDLADAQAAYSDYLARRGLNVFQALGDGVGLFGDEEQKLADAVTDANNRIVESQASIDRWNTAIADGEFAANDTAAAEAELADTRKKDAQQAIADAQAAEQAQRQAEEASAARVAQLQQQEADLLNNRAIVQANAHELQIAQDKIANRKEKELLVAHQDELQAIRESGAEKISAIDADIADIPNQLATALADASSKSNQALQNLQSDYMKNALKEAQDFNKESVRIAQDTQKQELRLRQDLLDSLADAERSNDIVSFLKTQRDGQKELKRNAEDASTAEQRRAEDFAQQQEQERAAYQERHDEILTQLAEERQKISEGFAERKSELEQQRAQEIANTQAALQASQQRFEQEQAQKAQAAADAASLQAIRDSQEQAAFQRQISNIQSRIAAENTAYSAAAAGISHILALAQSMGNISSTGTNASHFYGSPGPTGGSYQSPYQSAAFQQHSGGVTINLSPTVGDIATGAQVTEALNQYTSSIVGLLHGSTAKAQGG